MLPFGLRVKENGKKKQRFLSLVQNGDKVKVGVSCVSGCFQRRVWVPSLMVQSGALRESSLAVGDLTSAVGDVDGLSVAVLVVSRPGDGGSPRLHLPLQVHDAWASLADVTGKIANP